MDLKEDDYIEHLHICSTHDYLLFFTNRGKVYRLKVYELPEGSRTSKGKALVNVLPLRDGERVMAVIPTRDFNEGKYLVFATAQGLVKKTEFTAYNTPIRADGIIAIKIRDDDELVQVRLTSGDDDILLVSKSGHAIRFSEDAVRPMGRDTSGVKGMNVTTRSTAWRTGCWRWTSPATTRSSSSSPRTATASARRSTSTRSRAAARRAC